MKYFRYMLAFGLSLGVMFVAEYLIGRFSVWTDDWISGLNMPVFMPNETVYDICFTIALGFAVICCTFSTVKPVLRKTLVLWFAVAAVSVLWSVTLFEWHSLYGALGITVCIPIALSVLLHFYAKHTRELWLALIPAMAWYTYLFVFNYALCMLN